MSLTQEINESSTLSECFSIQPMDKNEEKDGKRTTNNSQDVSTGIDMQARDWFNSLSPTERSCATRFSDHAFLITFLALTTPWSNITPITPHDNGDHVGVNGKYKIARRFY
jgi:hypothetical protein